MATLHWRYDTSQRNPNGLLTTQWFPKNLSLIYSRPLFRVRHKMVPCQNQDGFVLPNYEFGVDYWNDELLSNHIFKVGICTHYWSGLKQF